MFFFKDISSFPMYVDMFLNIWFTFIFSIYVCVRVWGGMDILNFCVFKFCQF